MKNFVFISPNFPTNYWRFCRELKNNGLNVLGIGDQPYDELSNDLKNSLNEYYKVSSLENEDEVYRAVAFFIFKYGRIDWLESNNEYWLEKDAKLRTDFNITSGFQTADIPRIKYKSQMKQYYKKAGLAVARYYLVKDLEGCKKFIKKVGYPVVAKPDNGVGASHNFKIENEEQLLDFYGQRHEGVTYIMEEFVNGQVCSYDAIVNSKGEIMFEAGNLTPGSIMDMVNKNDDCKFCILKELPEDTKKAGRATVKHFGVKSRFVHLEFFRLTQDQKGLGKKGDIMGLEVNMRPSGGFSPDMINFAHSTDVYKIWADMIAFDKSTKPEGEHNYCAYIGRRDGKDYMMDHNAVMAKYGANIKMAEPLPDALS
ncbi:MAG: acetyl-CoA carboxylase biotin carboxylase subunit family protein, partial [Anaerotignum sp.]